MAMKGSEAHKNHILSLYICSYLSLTIFFIMDACLDPIFESTKGIEMKLYIDRRTKPLMFLF